MKKIIKTIGIGVLSFFGLFILAVLSLFLLPVFDMTAPLPSFPAEILIYKLVKPEVNDAYVAGFGAKLGMSGEVGQANGVYVMRDEATGASLEVNPPTGTLRYTIISKMFPETAPALPSNDKAVEIATRFLTERGLLREDVVASSVKVGSSVDGQPTNLLVSFDNLITTSGPVAKDSVRVGGGGEVVDAVINIPEYIPAKMAASKPVAQAYRELKHTRNKFTGITKLWVSIDSVQVEYWMEPENKGQEYLYPVYKFTGHSIGIFDGRRRSDYTGWVEATDESSIEFYTVS